MASDARLYGELITFLSERCPDRDARHLSLLGWMVDAHCKLGLSFVHIGLHWLQQDAIAAGHALHPQPRRQTAPEAGLVLMGGTLSSS